MCGDDDLHLLRQSETTAAFPATALNEVLHLQEQPLALGRSQPVRQWHPGGEERAPEGRHGRVDGWPRTRSQEQPKERSAADGERTRKHPARDEHDQKSDQHAMMPERKTYDPSACQASTRATLSIAHKLAWTCQEAAKVPASPNTAPTSRPPAAIRSRLLLGLALILSPDPG